MAIAGIHDHQTKQSARKYAVAAITTAALLLVLPVLAAPHLMLLDAPAHEARLAILRDLLITGRGSPFYSIDTFFLPNIAFDVIGLALTHFVSPETAGRIFLAITLLLTSSGVAVLNRVATGRWSIVPLASVLVAYHLVLILGFFSYTFGVALVLWALALRMKVENLAPAAKHLIGMIASIVLLFCHVFDFAIYAVMTGGFAYTALRQRRSDMSQALLRGLEVLPAVVLYSLMSTGHGSHVHDFLSPIAKLFELIKAMTAGSAIADLALLVGAASYILLLVVSSKHRLAKEFVPGLVVLAALFFILPNKMASGSYVDSRLPIAVVLLSLSSLDVQFLGSRPTTVRILIALIGIAFAVKQFAITVLWRSFTGPVDEIVSTLNELPAGSIIMMSQCIPEENTLLGVYDSRQPAMDHVTSFAAMDDTHFAAGTYAIRGQQPILVTARYAPYERLQATFEPTCDASQYRFRVIQIRNVGKTITYKGKNVSQIFLLLVHPLESPALDHVAKLEKRGRHYALYRVE